MGRRVQSIQSQMRKLRLSYVIRCSIFMAVQIGLDVYLTIKAFHPEGSLGAKVILLGALWGATIYFAVVLVHYYNKLDEQTARKYQLLVD